MLQNKPKQAHPDELHCFSCESHQIMILMLRQKLAAMEDDNRALQNKLLLQSNIITSMRGALENARCVIQTLQLGKRTSWQQSFVLLRIAQSSVSRMISLPAPAHGPRYIAQTDLETLICRTARKAVYGVGGVILEFRRDAAAATQGANWIISGIINGRAEQEAASKAVQQAAEKYASWVMVEDGSALNGKVIKARLNKAISSGSTKKRAP